jgi:hypothetical protein
VQSGLCADVSGASTANGAAVIQFECGPGENQQWLVSDVGGGAEQLSVLHSGKVLDVTAHRTQDGSLLEQYSANHGANQQFRLQPIVGTGGSGGTAGASSGVGGSGGTAGGATGAGANQVFSQSRFHFGTIDSIAKQNGGSTVSQVDFFTSGWMLGDAFDHAYVCDETRAGASLANQVPILVAYISAAHVKRADKTVCDCNVTSGSCVGAHDLCHVGAQRIAQEFPAIVQAYKSYSQGFASCYGTTRPIVFEMEPDWYQYTGSSQSQPWTARQAGQMMSQIVNALRSALPNARFSIDASPWVAPNNGSDNGAWWYSNFDMSLFTFVNTSGGGTNADTSKIRSGNNMTWAGLHQVTGKPILADTGYGANGAAAGEDPLWNVPANINARMADGVVSISQYSPTSGWGKTVASIRGQLNAPTAKP